MEIDPAKEHDFLNLDVDVDGHALHLNANMAMETINSTDLICVHEVNVIVPDVIKSTVIMGSLTGK